MEKTKIKRMGPILHVKMKENKLSTPHHNSDMRYHLLQGLCKSATLNNITDDINNLTRTIKTQKPLTLKAAK